MNNTSPWCWFYLSIDDSFWDILPNTLLGKYFLVEAPCNNNIDHHKKVSWRKVHKNNCCHMLDRWLPSCNFHQRHPLIHSRYLLSIYFFQFLLWFPFFFHFKIKQLFPLSRRVHRHCANAFVTACEWCNFSYFCSPLLGCCAFAVTFAQTGRIARCLRCFQAGNVGFGCYACFRRPCSGTCFPSPPPAHAWRRLYAIPWYNE